MDFFFVYWHQWRWIFKDQCYDDFQKDVTVDKCSLIWHLIWQFSFIYRILEKSLCHSISLWEIKILTYSCHTPQGCSVLKLLLIIFLCYFILATLFLFLHTFSCTFYYCCDLFCWLVCFLSKLQNKYGQNYKYLEYGVVGPNNHR